MKTLLMLFAAILFMATPALAGGRFEIFLGPFGTEQYLVDTQSGKVWGLVCEYNSSSSTAGQCDYSAWRRMDIEGITATPLSIMKNVQTYKKAEEQKQ